jgi:hypothetical protein
MIIPGLWTRFFYRFRKSFSGSCQPLLSGSYFIYTLFYYNPYNEKYHGLRRRRLLPNDAQTGRVGITPQDP